MPWKIFHNLYYLNYKIRHKSMLQPQEIENYQFSKLKVLIKYAYNKVPYYRALFDTAGVHPDDIRTKDDLYKIPITSKEKIRNLNLYDRIAKGIDINKCRSLRTSGSTGMPLDIYANEFEILRSKTLPFLHMFLDNGCRLTDRTLRITHPCHVTKKYWFQRLNILREYFVTIDNDIDVQLNKFRQIKPHAIRGYTSAIKSLALRIKEKGIKITPPKVIFTTAEVLTGLDRNTISSVFQTEVIDYYCCNEFGIIAWECKKHNGYHINSDNVIVELIKEDGSEAKAGEEGEIVITSLNFYTMPFIRYQIGDRGIWKDGACRGGNNNSLLLEAIIGRDNDQIILSSGRIISHYLLTSLMNDIPGIMEFQIVQKELDRITISVIKESSFNDEVLRRRIIKECESMLEEGIKIDPLIVKEIPKEKTGKFKVVKSEINYLRPYIFQ